MAPEAQGNRLPFEPQKKQQKSSKKKAKQQPPQVAETKKLPTTTATQQPPFTKEEMAVPKIVSDRMARRMALFCGAPTALGMLSFVVSYFIVSHHWFKLPTTAVLITSMGFFGLGILGLTYGLLSASWDEEIVGSKLGWQEFTTNWGRMMSAWRSTRQKNL